MNSLQQHRQNARTLEQFSLQASSFGAAGIGIGDESINRLLRITEVTFNDVVLDVACGAGQVVLAFAGIARHVTGVDLTPAMIEQAKKRQSQSCLTNIRWTVGDACDLPFPGGSFSVVTCRHALHHMLSPRKVVAEMTRCCAPGGRVCIADAFTTPENAAAYNDFERLRDPSHVRALSSKELVDLATMNHLEDIKYSFGEFAIDSEALLNGSFPESDQKENLRELIIQNVNGNHLGLRIHRNGAAIVVCYPIAFISAKRPELGGTPLLTKCT
jgi:SAM-dependent methyltransferase